MNDKIAFIEFNKKSGVYSIKDSAGIGMVVNSFTFLMNHIISKGFTAAVTPDDFPENDALALKDYFQSKTKAEQVNHPAHYGGKDNPYEVIKVMESWLTPEEFIGAMKFNIHKYNARARMKGSELENYEKAGFYQLALIDYCKRKNIGIKINA